MVVGRRRFTLRSDVLGVLRVIALTSLSLAAGVVLLGVVLLALGRSGG
jgi:hypothetical protein